MSKRALGLILGLVFMGSAVGQTLVGSASVLSPGCYQVTPNQNSVSGAVWFPGPVDASTSFEMRADVFLGANDGGADGMAFILRNPNALSIGTTPGGANQGFGGISPSIIVEMDTYTNSLNPAWDPVGSPADHLAILSAGSPSHQAASAFAGPIAAIPPNANIEDGQYHELRVTWDAETQLLQVHFDCLLRLEAIIDVPAVIGGDSGIYGFTASTGGLSNAHRVCDVQWNPFSPDVLPDEIALCPGADVTWTLPSGATDAVWSPADGLSSTDANEVTLTAEVEAVYSVAWVDACGAEHEDEVAVSLVLTEDEEVAYDLCPEASLELSPAGPGASVTWSDGSSDVPLSVNAAGTYVAEVDLEGCAFTWTAVVSELPAYGLDLGEDAVLCLGQTATLDATDPQWTGMEPVVLWSDGTEEGVRFDLGPGDYAVEVVAAGCTYTDAISLEPSPNTGLDLGQDVELCWYESAVWSPGYAASETSWSGLQAGGWSDLGTGAEWSWDGASAAGWEALAATVTVGTCVETDTVGIATVAEFVPDLPASVHFCAGSSVTLEAAPGADGYVWAGGPATASWTVDDPMTATLTATVLGCQVSESVEVIEDPVPPVNCGPDVFVCEGTPVTLDCGVFLADAFLWSGPMGTGNGPQFEAPVSGDYSVTVVEGDCEAFDEVSVTIQPLPAFDLGDDVLACPGTQEVLVAEGLPSQATLNWGHGPTSPEVIVSESGVYTAFAEWNGCFHYDAVQVAFAEALELDLAYSYLKCPEDTVYLSVALPPNLFPVTYSWSTGSAQPMESFAAHGDYSVSVSNACQTLETAFFIELQSCACELFVPTAFTPDNDGVNDAWRPEFNCPVTKYELVVMNRWGEVVFATSDPEAHWWGQITALPTDLDPYFGGDGLYQWQLELNYFQRGDARATQHAGHVLLVR